MQMDIINIDVFNQFFFYSDRLIRRVELSLYQSTMRVLWALRTTINVQKVMWVLAELNLK